MYLSRGFGEPYVMGSAGKLVDCGSWSNLFQGNCWNPVAQTYSMLDFTTQSDLGAAASPATQAAVVADAQATISQQCADYPTDCGVASSDNPLVAAAGAGVQQAVSEVGSLAAGAMPTWAWSLLIGGGALVLLSMVRR